VILPAFEPAESAEFDMEPDQVRFQLPPRGQEWASNPYCQNPYTCHMSETSQHRLMCVSKSAELINVWHLLPALASINDLAHMLSVALQTQHLPPQDVVRWGIADIAEGLAVQAEAISSEAPFL
jgi:hypothetical protein